MRFQLHFLICLFFISAPVHAIDWAWTLNNSSSTFTSTESDSSTDIAGTFSRLTNGFLDMTTTSGSGAQYPGNGTNFFPVEVPGFFLAVPPIISSETQMSFNVTSGGCPTETTRYNWTFQGWDGNNDLTQNTQGVFGEFTWNNTTQSATMNSIYNVTTYANPSWFSGAFGLTVTACSSGTSDVTYATPNTDRSGKLYLTGEGGFIYRTDANRLIFGVPQKKIQDAAILFDSYTAYVTRFDSSASVADNFKPIRMSIVSAGTSGSGDSLSDVTNNTTDSGYGTFSLTVDSLNSPIDGFFEGTLTRNAQSGKVACMTHFTNKTVIFCAGQTENSNTKPSNMILVSDNQKVGAVDHTFGSDGVFLTDLEADANYDGIWGMVEDSENRLILSGHANQGSGRDDDATIARIFSDGSLDTSFGSNGVLSFHVGGPTGTYDHARQPFIQSDGKIVIAGAFNATHYSTPFDQAIYRLTSDGQLDTTFGTGGIVTHLNSDGSDFLHTGAIDNTGRIIVGGSLYTTNDDIMVAAYLTNGDIDTSFGSNGRFIADYGNGGGEDLYSIYVDSSNRIVGGGWGIETDGSDIMTLFRLTSDGVLDTSFGTGGRVTTAGNVWPGQNWNEFHHCFEDSNNKIVCAGYSDGPGSNNVSLGRYLSNGDIDTSFGTGGAVAFDINGGVDRFYYAGETLDGKIVMSGYTESDPNGNHSALAARVHSNGNLDTSFGTSGTGFIFHSISTDENNTRTGYVDSKGRALIAGDSSEVGLSSDSFIIRIWN